MRFRDVRRGYIRLSVTGPTLEQQKDALRRGGIEDFSDHGPVYIDELPKRRAEGKDPLPERATLIRSLRPPERDIVVISDEGILGTSMDDTIRAAAMIAERGATIYVVSKAREFHWHPDAAEALDVMREAEHQRALWRAAHARKSATGARRGGTRALSDKDKALCKIDWLDQQYSGLQVSKKWGVSVETLYRWFGPKGTPRFGNRAGRRKSK